MGAIIKVLIRACGFYILLYSSTILDGRCASRISSAPEMKMERAGQ